MNKEVIKAMNKKETNVDYIKKWWNKNDYKVMRIVLFPVWFASIISEKVNAKLDARNTWSGKKANEVLNYYIPRCSEWCANGKEFYFFDNGMGWSSKFRQKKLKFRDRRWWNCHCGFWGGKIREYLIQSFELEGFEKRVLDTDEGRTKIVFEMIEK